MAKRLSQPASEPVTLADVKAQLNITDTVQDAIITRRIGEAREWIEEYLGRALLPSSWRIVLDAFDDQIELDMPPIISITSVQYIDVDGVTQTLAASDYVLDNASEPGWLLPAYDTDWPDTLDTINAVTIEYQAGYASAPAIPGYIKEALMLLVGHWMNHQAAAEAGIVITRVPLAVEQLLASDRVVVL